MCDSSTEGPVEEICAACGEPMDDYDDCLESEDGKHHSQREFDEMLTKLREAQRAGMDKLTEDFNKLRGVE